MLTEKRLVPCLNNLLAVTITRPEGQPELKPSILIIHGAGGSNQERSEYLATHFATLGHATLRFDQSGHGSSTGHRRNSSLARKQAEAEALLPLMQGPLTVIGSSMGAQTAAILTNVTEVKNLVFIAPAAYGQKLWSINFGPDFEFLIRIPGFWRDSPIWNSLKLYTGTMLLVTAGREERVNPGVARAFWMNSTNAHRIQFHLPESDHSIQLWLDAHKAYQSLFIRQITELL